MLWRSAITVGAVVACTVTGTGGNVFAADRGAPPRVVSIFGEAPTVLAMGDLLVTHPVTGVQTTQENGVTCQWSAHLSGSWESGGPGTYTAKNKATCSHDVDEIFYTATLYRNDEPVVSANDFCRWPCSYGVGDFDQRGCDICGGYFKGYFMIYIVDYDATWRTKANCTVSNYGHQLTCRYESAPQYAPS